MNILTTRTTIAAIAIVGLAAALGSSRALAADAKLGAFYLSLFGKDVKQGQTFTARVRMVFGQNITDGQAVQKYREYLEELAL